MVLAWPKPDRQFGHCDQATVQLSRRAGREATCKAAFATARQDSNQRTGALAPSTSRTFGGAAVKKCLALYPTTSLSSSRARFWISVAKLEKLHLRELPIDRGEGYVLIVGYQALLRTRRNALSPR